MAVSKTSICNAALTKIGGNLITSIDDDSVEARLCKERFDQVLDMLLEDHEWNFAMVRASLALLSSTPDWGYDYEFQLPSNPYCLRVVEVEDDYEYKIEGRKLLSDEDTINIKYVKRIDDLTELSPEFIESLTYSLAMELDYYINGSLGMKQMLDQEFMVVYRKAKTRDANQGTPKEQDTFSWISFRTSGRRS